MEINLFRKGGGGKAAYQSPLLNPLKVKICALDTTIKKKKDLNSILKFSFHNSILDKYMNRDFSQFMPVLYVLTDKLRFPSLV